MKSRSATGTVRWVWMYANIDGVMFFWCFYVVSDLLRYQIHCGMVLRMASEYVLPYRFCDCCSYLPALCKMQGVPFMIVKSKAQLGRLVHMKNATAICLTKVEREHEHKLASLCDLANSQVQRQQGCKEHSMRKFFNVFHTWGMWKRCMEFILGGWRLSLRSILGNNWNDLMLLECCGPQPP